MIQIKHEVKNPNWWEADQLAINTAGGIRGHRRQIHLVAAIPAISPPIFSMFQ